jgi:hypothetical protein
MAFLDSHPGLGFPAVAGLGLLVGSFLNVVILRLPRRLEWEWKRDAREILEEPEALRPATARHRGRALALPHCATRCPGTRTSRCSVGWPWVASAQLQGTDLHPVRLVEVLTALLFVPACGASGSAGSSCDAADRFLIALSGIDVRTPVARPADPAAAVAWAGGVGREPLRRPEGRPARCHGRLCEPVVGVLGVQATDRQGRHGPRRLQAARRAGRMDRAGWRAADHPAVLAGRRPGRFDLAGCDGPRQGHADSIRAVPGHCRLGQLHVGQGPDGRTCAAGLAACRPDERVVVA